MEYNIPPNSPMRGTIPPKANIAQILSPFQSKNIYQIYSIDVIKWNTIWKRFNLFWKIVYPVNITISSNNSNPNNIDEAIIIWFSHDLLSSHKIKLDCYIIFLNKILNYSCHHSWYWKYYLNYKRKEFQGNKIITCI